jgi:hypothetical protein
VEQLAQILDANPKRKVIFSRSGFNAEQSVVLATRPQLLDVSFIQEFAFLDGGAAFVDALEERQSSFGSLHLSCGLHVAALSDYHLKRLLQLEYCFEFLKITFPRPECALLPFSAKVNVLDFWVDASFCKAEDFQSLNIVPMDLSVTFLMEYDDKWDDLLIAFFDRLSELGHFERLSFSVNYRYYLDDGLQHEDMFAFDDVPPVVDALIRAIHANPKLSYLNLGQSHWRVNFTPHLQRIFEAVERHGSILTLVVQGGTSADIAEDDESDEDSEDGRLRKVHEFDFAWLKQLLSRNRHITVLDNSGNKCTNGSSIDRQSESLLQESTDLRPGLVAMLIFDHALTNFQHIALLLSHHADTI